MRQSRHDRISGSAIARLKVLACMFGLAILAGCQQTPHDATTTFRVLTYNVEFGRHASPEQFGVALKPYNSDLIAFNEVPGGDWVERVGQVLDMPYHYTGDISSANHQDKYKAILSRTPLCDMQEHELTGLGWNPASAVSAKTRIGGHEVVLYSLHVAGASSGDAPDPSERHVGELVDRVLRESQQPLVIVAGDFNDRMGEPVMDYVLNAGYRATWQDINLNVGRNSGHFTWQANGTAREGVIDHLLYRQQASMCAVDGGIITSDSPLSDHHPIWADFQIRGE